MRVWVRTARIALPVEAKPSRMRAVLALLLREALELLLETKLSSRTSSRRFLSHTPRHTTRCRKSKATLRAQSMLLLPRRRTSQPTFRKPVFTTLTALLSVLKKTTRKEVQTSTWTATPRNKTMASLSALAHTKTPQLPIKTSNRKKGATRRKICKNQPAT